MRIVIDKARCSGHARCAAIAPDLFELDPLGYIAIDGFTPPAGREADARRGANACPERIITVLTDSE